MKIKARLALDERGHGGCISHRSAVAKGATGGGGGEVIYLTGISLTVNFQMLVFIGKSINVVLVQLMTHYFAAKVQRHLSEKLKLIMQITMTEKAEKVAICGTPFK